MASKVEVPGNTTATAGGRPWWQELLLRAPGGPIPRRVALTLLIAAGAGLTVYSGYIHLYLWGRQPYPYPYRAIATIGPLFLLQGIVGILIGALVVITRRFFAVLLAAGFMVVSVAALVIDVEVGLFGFQDSWQVPYATSTLYEEIVGAVVLLIASGALAWPSVASWSRRDR
jgi:hypothetical protein